MNKKALGLIILLLLVLAGCGGEKPQPTAAKPKPENDPKRVAFQKNIDSTNQEGKDMIEKIKAIKPLVNDKIAAKPLGEIADDFATKNGDYNTKPIGWAASQKVTSKNWKIVYYYQDYTGQYNAAEWEYNIETKQLYPFELVLAPTFYTDIGGAGNSNTPKAGK